jgi:hypothetical protein
MTSSSLALQIAIFEALRTDAGVLAALGGPRVYDHVPRKTDYPYLTFAQTTVQDWSTGADEGDEHIITLHVWSRAESRTQLQEIIAAVRAALHDRDLPLIGHRLINLRYQSAETRREPDGERFRGIIRLRAVTEPLA